MSIKKNIHLKDLIQKHKSWFIPFCLAVLFMAFEGLFVNQKERLKISPKDISAGVDIPKGFLLIPLQIQNFENLDSIFGNFGYVHVYNHGNIIAKHVKAIRAPLNPKSISILVPENFAELFLKPNSLFTLSLSSKKDSGTEFVRSENKEKNRRIILEGS